MTKGRKNIFSQLGVCWLVLAACGAFALPIAAQKKDIQPGVPEGYTLIDGDILMPDWLLEQMKQPRSPHSVAPNAAYNFFLWTDGIVPYEFGDMCAPTSTCTNAPTSGCVSAANQTNMQAAMAELEAVANVDFRQCPNNDCFASFGNINYIIVRDSTNDTTANPADNSCINNSRNSSAVGMIGIGVDRSQIINIVSWGTRFIIVHELLHALGFYHEHQRPDRGTYVTINCGNVQGGCSGSTFTTNFPIQSDATSYNSYDFDSVMHYGQCSFSSATNCPASGITINVNPPWTMQWQGAIGQRTHLSVLDRATVSFLYPQPNWRFVDCTYNGSNGPPNGFFLRPYTSLAAALANTPAGGTIWISESCPPFPTGTYSNQVTIRVAPNRTASFGGL